MTRTIPTSNLTYLVISEYVLDSLKRYTNNFETKKMCALVFFVVVFFFVFFVVLVVIGSEAQACKCQLSRVLPGL